MTTILYRKVVLDDFQDVSGWTGTGNCATAGYGASLNTSSTYIKTGSASMLVGFDYDADTTGSVSKTDYDSLDASGFNELWVNVYVEDKADMDSTTAFRVYFGTDDSNRIYNTYVRADLANGWNVLKMTLDSPDGTEGVCDLTDVTHLQFNSTDASVSDYSLYVDSVWLMQAYTFPESISSLQRTGGNTIASHVIPMRGTPRHQLVSGGEVTWTLSYTGLDDSSRDRIMDASLLDSLEGERCVLETGIESGSVECRDDDGESDADAALDDEDDYFKKMVYVGSTRNLKSATVYAYLKEDDGNSPQDADSITVCVNGVDYLGAWTGLDTTGSYQWLTLTVSPELIVPGLNEIVLHGVGVSEYDIFHLGTDTDSDAERSSYSTNIGGSYSNATGEYMVYLLVTYEELSQRGSEGVRDVLVSSSTRKHFCGRPGEYEGELVMVEDRP